MVGHFNLQMQHLSIFCLYVLSDVLKTYTVMAMLTQELTHWQAIDWEPLTCP